jgi:methionine synthase II (cobalamin-independent)
MMTGAERYRQAIQKGEAAVIEAFDTMQAEIDRQAEILKAAGLDGVRGEAMRDCWSKQPRYGYGRVL